MTADKSDFTRGSNRSIKSPIRTQINSSPKTLSKPFDLNRTSFIITFAKTPKMVSLHYTTQFQLSFVFAWLQVIQRYLTGEHSVWKSKKKSHFHGELIGTPCNNDLPPMTMIPAWRPENSVKTRVSKSKCKISRLWLDVKRTWTQLTSKRWVAAIRSDAE